MNEALVVILAVMWALILLPSAVRGRRSSPQNTVGGFERAMDVLGHRGAPGRYLMVPDDAERIVGDTRHGTIVHRRRRLFSMLVVANSVLLFGGLVAGNSMLWILWILSTVVLGGYVLLLLRYKAQKLQAEWVVRTLPPREAAAQRFHLERVVGGDAPLDLQVVTDPHAPWEPSAGVRIRRWED